MMTDNVFDNAAKSLQQAKDDMTKYLVAEEARHQTALDIENKYHAERVFELEKLIAQFSDRIPQVPVAPKLPHSRACGITAHEHGTYCSTNCPTCHGMQRVGGWGE